MELITFFSLLLIGIYSCYGSPLPAFNLQCDRNLVGLSSDQLRHLHNRHHFATDNPRPLFTWNVAHTERGAVQTGFRVLVSTDVTFEHVVWDSGLVTSTDEQMLQYGGPSLQGGVVYLWRVTWWDSNGDSATSQETGHFMAVTLTPQDWEAAKWIAAPDRLKTAPTFVKQISTMNKPIGTATLYVSGLGYFRAWVNGVDLHQRADPPIFLAPGWTNYEVRIPYMAFDITSLMNISQPSVKIMLGEGWRNTAQFPPHDKWPVPDSVPCVLRVMLTIVFKDLSSEKTVIYSDATWDVQTSLIQSSSVYGGEVYDATVAPTVVGKAVETPGPAGIMYLPTMPSIAETGATDTVQGITLDPQSTDDHNKQIVDFGNNTAGVVRIKVDGVAKGQIIQLKHAEVFTHPPYGKRDGSLFYGNLRSASQLDQYTSSGEEKFYQPTFTYHGFQYVLVTNYPRKLVPSDLYKVRVNTYLLPNSAFNVSSDLLNNIQENVVRGQLSNLMSVPTDCDQRDERLGWMGDAGLSADSMALNFHMESFFPHRAMLIKDEQMSGNIPDVVPFYHGGGRPSDPSWGAAYPQTVWVLWKYYGDTNTAKTYYSSLLEYIDFVESQVPSEGIGKLPGRYGDWVPPPPSKKIGNSFTSAFSFMQNIQQMAEIAKALGDTDNATRLQGMFSKHAAEFNKAFYSNYQYLDNSQASYALPLVLNIVPADDKDKVATNFIHQITGPDKSHVTTGIVSVKALLPALTDLKQHDLAMTIVSQIDYPSWGYMIHNPDEPATAIWELWNSNSGSSGMDSRNHHMYSSVSSWMQTDMIGFKQQDKTYGYKALDLYPAQSLDLSSASIKLEHPLPIKYSWHRQGGLQCGKAAEDQSSLNPTLPKHGGLYISCGEGIIGQVKFASYGNPVGSCGYHSIGSCHSPHSHRIVESLCLNKTECLVPTGGDYWDDPCPGQSKWLTAAVLCKTSSSVKLTHRYSSLKVSVSVPVSSSAHLHVPAYGMSNLTVWDDNQIIYSEKRFMDSSIKGVKAIRWNAERMLLQLDVISGEYQFTVRGAEPEETKSLVAAADHTAHLTCSNNRTISSIDWVSYGNPSVDSNGQFILGSCHSGASKFIVENACLGKKECSISLKEAFGKIPCEPENEWNLAVHYSCNQHA